jgi:hypothetical protein
MEGVGQVNTGKGRIIGVINNRGEAVAIPPINRVKDVPTVYG